MSTTYYVDSNVSTVDTKRRRFPKETDLLYYLMQKVMKTDHDFFEGVYDLEHHKDESYTSYAFKTNVG